MKQFLFKLFLIMLLIIPVSLKPNTVCAESNNTIAVKQLTSEDYKQKTTNLCIYCVSLDIIILVAITALIIRYCVVKEQENDIKNKNLKKK